MVLTCERFPGGSGGVIEFPLIEETKQVEKFSGEKWKVTRSNPDQDDEYYVPFNLSSEHSRSRTNICI